MNQILSSLNGGLSNMESLPWSGNMGLPQVKQQCEDYGEGTSLLVFCLVVG